MGITPSKVWGIGFVVIAMFLLCAAGARVEAESLSPAQKTLAKIPFDREALAGEVFSELKSAAAARVIVTLIQPDPIPHTKEMSEAQHEEIFRAKNHLVQEELLSQLSPSEFTERFRFDNFAGFSGEVTELGLKELLDHPSVLFVEPVRVLEAHLAQGIPLMNASTVRTSYNGSGMSIAICDTGVDYTHPRLGNGGFPNAKVIGGYDFGDNDGNPMPNGNAHGTSCAGIAAGDLGTVNDYIGGVAYNAKLYALKISQGTGGAATSDAMIGAWDWCVTHRNDNPAYPLMVISTSFGGGRYFSSAEADAASPAMTTAANNAVAAGITVLASSGNDGFCNSMGWPAAISSVISVGAVYDANIGTAGFCANPDSCKPADAGHPGCDDGIWWDQSAPDRVTAYSNTASFLTVLAPSHNAYTADITGADGYSSGDYASTFGGTSAACPYAAGAVACLQSAAQSLLGRYLTVAEVRSTLISTGVNITDPKIPITKPRINLRAAVDTLGGAEGEVEGEGEGEGEGEIERPANDDFANGIVLSGANGSTTGTNVNATKQKKEPKHGGNTGGASVWWVWTAPCDGNVTIETCGSDFDTTLGVYTGGIVNILTSIAQNDDSCELQSHVTFDAKAGTVYRIAVDGYLYETGDIELSWSMPCEGEGESEGEGEGEEEGSCWGRCGQQSGDCYCDEVCIEYGDCCSNICEACSTFEWCEVETESEGEGEIEQMEGDVAPRVGGDGSLLVNDWVQVGRFVAGLDAAAIGSEFANSDCAPYATRGDGALNVADWVQAGRYVAGLDMLQEQAGPKKPQ